MVQRRGFFWENTFGGWFEACLGGGLGVLRVVFGVFWVKILRKLGVFFIEAGFGGSDE
jgi:hypothetical protein